MLIIIPAVYCRNTQVPQSLTLWGTLAVRKWEKVGQAYLI